MHTTCSMKCHNKLKSMKMQNKLPETLSFYLNLLLLDQHFKSSKEKERVVRKGEKFMFCNFA